MESGFYRDPKNPRVRLRSPWSFAVDPAKGKFDWRENEPADEEAHSDRAAQALHNRYGWKTPIAKKAQLMMADMGLGEYNLILDNTRKSEAIGGRWNDDMGRVEIFENPKEPTPGWTPNSLFHELSHMADDIVYPGHQGAAEPGWGKLDWIDKFNVPQEIPGHFVNSKNRIDLMNGVIGQEQIEQGQTPDPRTLEQQPWLRDVVPNASNRLAAPWRKELDSPNRAMGMTVPPDTWNKDLQEKNSWARFSQGEKSGYPTFEKKKKKK